MAEHIKDPICQDWQLQWFHSSSSSSNNNNNNSNNPKVSQDLTTLVATTRSQCYLPSSTSFTDTKPSCKDCTR